jgi:hypothetical protein
VLPTVHHSRIKTSTLCPRSRHLEIPPSFMRRAGAIGKRWREKLKPSGRRICEWSFFLFNPYPSFCSRETALLEGCRFSLLGLSDYIIHSALAIGLEKYQLETEGIRVNKPLNRFPFRNKFISNYVFAVTGTKRTPKQVGSRLQQLRDTCKDKKSRWFRPAFYKYLYLASPKPTKSSS